MSFCIGFEYEIDNLFGLFEQGGLEIRKWNNSIDDEAAELNIRDPVEWKYSFNFL